MTHLLQSTFKYAVALHIRGNNLKYYEEMPFVLPSAYLLLIILSPIALVDCDRFITIFA